MTLRRRSRQLGGLIVICALASAACATAGEFHYGTSLNCSQCHIMHGSKDANVYNSGNGFAGLLKGTVNQTCLSCHDTTNRDCVASGLALTPNDTLGTAYPSPYKNSSGYFQSDWATAASPVGHDLGPGSVTAIQGTWTSGAGGMTCTDCHDAHGSPNFRNMKLRPGTAQADVTVAEGQEVHIKAGLSGWANTRDTSAVAFNDPNHIVDWCIGCHTNITTGEKHPQDVALSGGDADSANWTGATGTGAGFGAAVGDATAGIPRVRFAQAGTDYTSSSTVASTNKVFCLSCHKAHGSKYDSALVWPYDTAGAADRTSACAQCHNR